VRTIATTHQRVAQAYFDDETVSYAIPPLRALLEIMANGASAEGWTLTSPEFRSQFEAESILASAWYAERLDSKQAAAASRAAAGLAAMEKFISTPGNEEPSERLGMADRIAFAQGEIARFATPEYRASLVGTVGRQPL
jgi:hypothetical protein